MNILTLIRRTAHRHYLRPTKAGHYRYRGTITISLQGQTLRKVQVDIRANSRREADQKLSQRIAADIGVTHKITRLKG